MTQKEKLIELITPLMNGVKPFVIESAADYLINSGVIVLPSKVGDKFFYHGSYAVNGEAIGKTEVCEEKVQFAAVTDDGFTVYDERGLDYDPDQIFLTREEAEAALKGE